MSCLMKHWPSRGTTCLSFARDLTVAFQSLCANGFHGRSAARGGATFPGSGTGLLGQRSVGSRAATFFFQRATSGARTRRRGPAMGMALSHARVPLGPLPGLCRDFPLGRRLELYTSPPRFLEDYRDGLFRRTRTMLAFANVVHFFTDK